MNTSTDRSLRRRITSIAALLALTLTAGLALSPAAGARIIDGGGAVGPYLANSAITCQHKIRGQYQSVAMTVPPPTVWARNARAGANNDSAWIRFRAHLVDHRTGRTLQTSGWSGWAQATDVSFARFSGNIAFSGEVGRGQIYSVDYQIEWWNQTSRTAWIMDRSTNYLYLDFTNTGKTSMSACWRFS